MRKFISILSIITLMASCSSNRNAGIASENIVSTFNSVKEYNNSINHKQSKIVDSTHFVFANNPYNFNDDCHITIFINNIIRYNGKYSKSILVNISEEEGELINIAFEVLVPSSNKFDLYRFTNKSTITWNKNYDFIYSCTFPSNPIEDRVHFFPTNKDITH